ERDKRVVSELSGGDPSLHPRGTEQRARAPGGERRRQLRVDEIPNIGKPRGPQGAGSACHLEIRRDISGSVTLGSLRDALEHTGMDSWLHMVVRADFRDIARIPAVINGQAGARVVELVVDVPMRANRLPVRLDETQ